MVLWVPASSVLALSSQEAAIRAGAHRLCACQQTRSALHRGAASVLRGPEMLRAAPGADPTLAQVDVAALVGGRRVADFARRFSRTAGQCRTPTIQRRYGHAQNRGDAGALF